MNTHKNTALEADDKVSPSLAPRPSPLTTATGIIFDIQRYSVHDGPGLRTNVFLKGCPLRCGWCANPESQTTQQEPILHAANCIDCGQFAEPCTICFPRWLAARRSDVQAEIDARAAVCPTGALHWVGVRRTAGEVMDEVCRDRPFYGAGGGLTITGGEPTMQPAFCAALLHLARAAGIATAMETCGHTQWEVYAGLLPDLDVVLFDVKHMDPAVHRAHTGMGNELILANLARLAAAGATVRVRVPLIPGFNANPADVAAIAAFVRTLPGPIQGVDVLPYHALARSKYAALGRDYPWHDHARLPDAEVQRYADIVASYGIDVAVGG